MHVPFCAARCDYCAFATWTDRHHLQEPYARACVTEIERAALPPASTVFFGGGTPSLLDPRLLAGILAAIPRAAGAEVTVECNPETVTDAALETYAAAGVTRLSFGVQSMAPHVLAALGRGHDPDGAVRAVAAARRAGFDNWNADLIFGGAGESLDDWRRSLEMVLDLDPPHVSAYALTVESGSPLARDPSRHPDDDDLADKYAVADEMLEAAGLGWYEVSNWARSGRECRHNQLYWLGGAYRGIGCAAHSFDGTRRWWNVRTPDRYIERIDRGRSPEAGQEILDPPARALEASTMALRTRHGVAAEAFAGGAITELGDLVAVDGGRAVLTRRGRLLANEVSLRLER